MPNSMREWSLNEVDGLQIKKDGVWIPVSFLPDALVVNVGDILEASPHTPFYIFEIVATVFKLNFFYFNYHFQPMLHGSNNCGFIRM